MKYPFLFLFFLIAFYSCKNTPELSNPNVVTFRDGLTVINLNNLEQGPLIPFDSLFSGYEYIVNSEGERFKSSGWDFFFCDKDKNFITTDVITQQVTLYDSLGNRIRTIGKQGVNLEQGEYRETCFATVSIPHKMIYIIAHLQGKILKYDYQGRFLGAIDLVTSSIDRKDSDSRLRNGALCNRIAPTPDGNLLIYYAWWAGNLAYNYCLLDGKTDRVLQTKKTMGDFNGKTKYRGELRYYTYNNRLHVCDLSDTSYVIENNTFIPKYVFEQKNTIARLTDSLGPNVNIYNVGKQIYKIGAIQETDRYLFFSYHTLNPVNSYPSKDTQYACYDKKIKQAYNLFTEEKWREYRYTQDSIEAFILYYPTGGSSHPAKHTNNQQGRIRVYLK